jgi:cell wall-associated NlpC family hydrolase
MQRLAQEVNWYLFSNGNTLYYMDGPQFGAQGVSVYLRLDDAGTTWTAINPPDGDTATDVVSNLTYTFDNTAFQYQETHVRKGRVQRRTGVRTPQTPSQVKMNMICGIVDYRAGDVFVFQNSGIIDGRWIVEDATRNCLADRSTQFTLGPPVLPNLEPASTSAGALLSGQTPTPTGSSASTNSTTSPTAGAPGSPGNTNSAGPYVNVTDSAILNQGTGLGVAQAAAQAYNDESGGNVYQYISANIAAQPGKNGYDLRSNGGQLFGPSPRQMDCSAFATLCYRAAGLPDPSHQNYAKPNLGYTGSLIARCTSIPAGQAQPGDLCFYGASTSATEHVTVHIGNGTVISMGQQGDPSRGPAAAMGPAGFLGYFRPDVNPNPVYPTSTPPPPTGTPPAGVPPSLWSHRGF